MIRLRDVTKIHRRGETEVHALRGVTCEFARGSFTFVVGPSGSGKSTLLYLIGALDEPTSGEITVEDRRLSDFTAGERNDYRRDRVGFVFQNFNLLKNLTALENVLVPYLPRGIAAEMRSRASDLLAQVGLADRRDHRPSQLSGGEQQRVALARALLKQPAMVLADEPTGELDTQSGAEVFRYLRNLHQERGTTVIVVSHDDRYLVPSDGVLKLRDGMIEASVSGP
jgi:putative ABC transport system ATP-binding protein